MPPLMLQSVPGRATAACRPALKRTLCASVKAQQHAGPRHVLITGGNTGIGYETAKSLCSQGYAVTIACRDDNKAARAASGIRSAVPGAQINTLHLDLASLDSVRAAAAQWLDSGVPVDVLINNGGVMACPKMATADGFEYQLGVNHLGHYLFTNLLLPQMKAATSPVRIINVSSSAHVAGKMNWDDLMFEKSYNPWQAYSQSKLANVLFTYELARRLQPSTRITVNALHPGVVRTELARYLIKDPDAWTSKLLALAFTPFTKSPEEGAQTSIHLASSPEVEGLTSKYWSDCKAIPSNAASYDTDTAARLWQVSEELTASKQAKLPAAV